MLSVRDPAARDELLEQRVVVLEGAITEAVCHEVLAKMLFLQHESRNQPIHLFIDSPGGFVSFAAHAHFDAAAAQANGLVDRVIKEYPACPVRF
ncbi:ATP-dependent Clp protease proteolytic subunit [Lignipirellula cremea]|uniref:ATP-dependent Clp protease proteolytic subunit n=1 Tax=Lignipirellula cremea TaxID=2528010 RepID=A0A518DKZ0_9BACT|nr:ATP-dependent Clp protease proteolytic subunit [Lignipirellula cremea]QDU92501.1 ATP-dependent Clp protease proteolytic subunit [Lignipirellula cremea]